MAAVDQRLGVVRRGVTPAAPKPINLPSQKFENHRLIPDVEIVPRGTCCWGSAGRSIPASGSNNDKTDSASPALGSNGAEDHGRNVQNDSVSTDEAKSPAEKLDQAHSVESSTSPASSTVCITSAETCSACSNLGVGNISAKEGSDSPTASDAGSFPGIVARPSSSESYSSSSVTPTRVEEQKHFSGLSQVCSGDNEKVSNAQAKQETHAGDESSPGSQDFGYFEGFYNTQSPFSRPGVPFSNVPGMAFGPGVHSEPSHHYSFLGVPYYDSVKDKEIVVITMVGNPGVYGSYLPCPGFPNQFGRPSVYGNLPLQFGRFEHCVGPQVPAEMNPMHLGEDSGYVCYEQENYKQGWVNGSPVGNGQRSNGLYFPTSLSTFELNSMSDDCSMPKRTGRQKAVNRNRRPTREASPMPERRVTLLTKVSQHEVIISNMQRKSKYGGARRAKNTFSPHVFRDDVIEVAQNSLGSPVCASQPKEAIPREASTSDMVQVQSSASHSTFGRTALESTETATLSEVVNVEKSCDSDVSVNTSAHELTSPQAACRQSTSEDSISEPRCKEDARAAVSEPSVTSSILIPLPISTSNSTISASQVSNRIAAHQGSPPTCSYKIQVPGSSVEDFNFPVENIRFKSEVRCVSKVGEIWLGGHCNNLTESAASFEPAFESTDDNKSLSALAAACLPNEHMEESPRKLLAQKGDKKWRRKGSVEVTKLGQGVFSQKIQDSGVDKRVSCYKRASDTPRDVMHTAGSGSLSSSPRKVKPVSEGGLSLCYGTSAALSSCDESVASNKNGKAMVSLVDTTEDQLCEDKSSKGAEARSPTAGGLECGVQVDSSMKTSSAAGDQSSLPRVVSCGAGKMWRPKLSGVAGGHDNSGMKDSEVKFGKVSAAPNVSGLQVRENGSISDCTGLSYTLEVLREDYGKDNHKKQLKVCNVQDEGCNKLSNMASSVSKVPCDYHEGERSDQQPSHNVNSVEDMQGNEKKPFQTVQKQQRSEDLHSTHDIETNPESSRNVEVEFNLKKSSSPRKNNLGKQGNTWRVVGKQMPQQKPPLVSKLEPEHNSSVVKSKESVNSVQGVSWKPKQLCTVNKGSFNGVEVKASSLALQNEICAEGKEQGSRRPFSMKNFLNDDNRKATQLQQSLIHSSAHMGDGMVRENMCTVGIGHGKSHSSSRITYMKVGRGGEFHIAKKVDRKGWVVKTETARSKA